MESQTLTINAIIIEWRALTPPGPVWSGSFIPKQGADGGTYYVGPARMEITNIRCEGHVWPYRKAGEDSIPLQIGDVLHTDDAIRVGWKP